MTELGARHVLLAPCLALLVGCPSFHAGPLPGRPAKATYATVEGIDLHFVDSGPKAGGRLPLVLVHGFGADVHEWRRLRPRLEAAGHRVLALDLKGHGWSGRPAGDYSIEAHARLVLQLAAERGIDRFVVIGHSWGSAVALSVAQQAPRRVARVVLFNGMFFQDQQPLLFHWSRLGGMGELVFGVFYTERLEDKMSFSVYDQSLVREEAIERVRDAWTRPGARAAALATIRAMDFTKLEAGYRKLPQPVLLLWGREDHVTPLAFGERLSLLLPRARLEVIPRCGHIPMLEATARSYEAIVAFLREEAAR